jgi:epoxyqueuosine reductase
LDIDQPKRPGVAKFCDICTKCADACPVKALPFGSPKVGGGTSSIQGVKKWTSDAEKCFSFWAKLSSDCAICMRVCPFNRDLSSWPHRLWLRLALSPARRFALWLDRYRAGRLKPSSWWAQR